MSFPTRCTIIKPDYNQAGSQFLEKYLERRVLRSLELVRHRFVSKEPLDDFYGLKSTSQVILGVCPRNTDIDPAEGFSILTYFNAQGTIIGPIPITLRKIGVAKVKPGKQVTTEILGERAVCNFQGRKGVAIDLLLHSVPYAGYNTASTRSNGESGFIVGDIVGILVEVAQAAKPDISFFAFRVNQDTYRTVAFIPEFRDFLRFLRTTSRICFMSSKYVFFMHIHLLLKKYNVQGPYITLFARASDRQAQEDLYLSKYSIALMTCQLPQSEAAKYPG